MMRKLLSTAFVCVLTAAGLSWAGVAPEGDEFQANTYTSDEQENPVVAADRKGNFVVVWEGKGQDGDGEAVFAQRFNRRGYPVGPEFRVSTETAGDQWDPSVAMNASRRFVVAWESMGQDGSDAGIFAQRFNRKGQPAGPEFRVNTYTTGYQMHPSVGIDGGGNFVVVWSSYGDGDGYGIFGQRFDLQGNPLGTEFQVNTDPNLGQYAPSLSMHADGRFVVVWESLDTSGEGVFGQLFDSSGSKVGGEFQVNTEESDDQEDPSAAMNADGSFVAVWESYGQDGAERGVFMQRFDSSGSMVGAELQVNTDPNSNQEDPAVAVDASGEFMVVWESDLHDGDGMGVFGQLFDSAGAMLGAEFQINTHTMDDQEDAAVASGPRGTFIVTWDSYVQDGEGEGVFGQRISAHSPILTAPLSSVDCTDPASIQPTFTWETDGHERFKVFMSRDDTFIKAGTVSSGDERITTGTWTPRAGKWQRACNKIDPQNPEMYIKVKGIDRDLPKWNINRKQSSPVVKVSVQP
jgi:hypothetical protein